MRLKGRGRVGRAHRLEPVFAAIFAGLVTLVSLVPPALADAHDVVAVSQWLDSGYLGGGPIPALLNLTDEGVPVIEALIVDFAREHGAIRLSGRFVKAKGRRLLPPRLRPSRTDRVFLSSQAWIGVFRKGKAVYLAPAGAPFVSVSERFPDRDGRWDATINQKEKGRLTIHIPRVRNSTVVIFRTDSASRQVVAADFMREERPPGEPEPDEETLSFDVDLPEGDW